MRSGPYPGIWSNGSLGNHLQGCACKTISLGLTCQATLRSGGGNCLVFKEKASCAALTSQSTWGEGCEMLPLGLWSALMIPWWGRWFRREGVREGWCIPGSHKQTDKKVWGDAETKGDWVWLTPRVVDLVIVLQVHKIIYICVSGVAQSTIRNRLTDRHTNRLIDWPIDGLTDPLTDWLLIKEKWAILNAKVTGTEQRDEEQSLSPLYLFLDHRYGVLETSFSGEVGWPLPCHLILQLTVCLLSLSWPRASKLCFFW